MRSPTARLLALLELLQDRPHATGRELAASLDVDGRTLRRYVTALQELGIPVEGQRGVGGGYRIRPGYRLPPLMLGDGEVVAVVLGLLAARANRLPAAPDAVDGALAKLNRVLPPTLRRQVDALESTVLFSGSGSTEPVAGDALLLLAEAIRRRRQVRATYTSFDGIVTSRTFSPFGLVVHCGRWYLAAHDHLREALRTFRVDRMQAVLINAKAAAIEPPDDFDAVDYIGRSLATMPWTHEISVVLDLPFESATARLSPRLGLLSPTEGGTRLEMSVDSLDWMARVLAGLGCSFTIEQPPELRARVAALAARLETSARAE
jgi:predicted DNA-binding transcriptional regulator YafY